MTPRLDAAVREHMAAFRMATYEGTRSPWVFHHVRTRRHHGAGTRIGSLRNAFRNAAKRAGLPPEFHQHDLRHRRVTTWLAEGKNPVHVMEAMGHSDLKTTMGYTHLSKTHLRALVREDASTWSPRLVPDQRRLVTPQLSISRYERQSAGAAPH
jgi:integrase